MEQRDYSRFENEGLIKSQPNPMTEHLTESGRKGWSRIQNRMFKLRQIDLSKAAGDCEFCNSTGIERNVKMGGSPVTVVCRCLPDNAFNNEAEKAGR